MIGQDNAHPKYQTKYQYLEAVLYRNYLIISNHIFNRIIRTETIQIFSDNELLLGLPGVPVGRFEAPDLVSLPLLVELVVAHLHDPMDVMM